MNRDHEPGLTGRRVFIRGLAATAGAGVLAALTSGCDRVNEEIRWQADPNNVIQRIHPRGTYLFRRRRDGTIGVNAMERNTRAPDEELSQTCGTPTVLGGNYETSISNYSVTTPDPECFDKLKSNTGIPNDLSP